MTTWLEYCPKCKTKTEHTKVEDIFDYAAECLVCHMIWEMKPFYKVSGDIRE